MNQKVFTQACHSKKHLVYMNDKKTLEPVLGDSVAKEVQQNVKTHEVPPASLRTVTDLRKFIKSLNRSEIPSDYRIAVGGFILDQNNQLVLIERGALARDSIGKLEGIGGGVDDNEEDLHSALLREIGEEIGLSGKQVKIITPLTVKTLPGKTTGGYWVVPIYVCKIQEGEPYISGSGEVKAIKRFSLDHLPEENVSEYEKVTMQAYLERKTQGSL